MTGNAKTSRPLQWWERVPAGATLAENCGICGQALTDTGDEMVCLACDSPNGHRGVLPDSSKTSVGGRPALRGGGRQLELWHEGAA